MLFPIQLQAEEVRIQNTIRIMVGVEEEGGSHKELPCCSLQFVNYPHSVGIDRILAIDF